jgi:hypothetical protein
MAPETGRCRPKKSFDRQSRIAANAPGSPARIAFSPIKEQGGEVVARMNGTLPLDKAEKHFS